MSTPVLVNAATLDELGAMIGEEKLSRVIERYAVALADAFSEDGRQPADVGREAHMLVSMAGMLGCDALCDACRDLESRGKHAGDLTVALAEARTIRDETLAALTEWRCARTGAGA